MEQRMVEGSGKTNLSCSEVGVLERHGRCEGLLCLLLSLHCLLLLRQSCRLDDSKVGVVQARLRS